MDYGNVGSMAKSEWQKLVDRPMTLITGDTIAIALKGKLFGLPFDNGMTFSGDRGQPIERIAHRQVINENVNGWTYEDLEKFVRDGESVCHKLQKLNYDHGDLISGLDLYLDNFAELVPLMMAVFSIEPVLESRLNKMLPGSVKLDDILNDPNNPSEASQFQTEMLQVAANGCQENQLKSLADKYYFTALTNHLKSKPLDVNTLSKQCADLKDAESDLQKILTKTKEESKTYEDNKSKLSSEAQKYLELLHRYQHFRDERIKTFKIFQYNHLRPILQEASDKTNVPYDDIIWYTIDELKSLINSKNKADVNARKEQCTVLSINGELSYPSVSPLDKDFDIEKLTARPAQPGLARGKVRIVLSHNDGEKLNEGEILVTTMTTPDFVPAMKRSAAIVTDEGGILCHAAIVSRELGKPCIIGTEHATKFLKDGDEVVVDANNGIVTIV